MPSYQNLQLCNKLSFIRLAYNVQIIRQTCSTVNCIQSLRTRRETVTVKVFLWDGESREDVRHNIFWPNRRSEPRLAGSSYKPSVRSGENTSVSTSTRCCAGPGLGEKTASNTSGPVTRQEGEKIQITGKSNHIRLFSKAFHTLLLSKDRPEIL